MALLAEREPRADGQGAIWKVRLMVQVMSMSSGEAGAEVDADAAAKDTR